MNAVARIFVVINLLLAGGFLLAAATFLHQNTKWKEELVTAEKKASDEQSEMQGQITSLQTELTGVRSDLNSSKQSVTTLENDNSNLDTRLKAEGRAKLGVERILATTSGNMSTLTTNVDGLKGELGMLRGQVDDYRDKSIKALEAQRGAEAAAAMSAKAADDAKTQIQSLTDDLSNTKSDLKKTAAILAGYVGVYPPPALKAQAKVDGAVIRYDAGTMLVEINKGSADGIAFGHELDIVRDSKGNSTFIGTIRISRVEANSSVGSIYIPAPGQQPRAGDTATKL